MQTHSNFTFLKQHNPLFFQLAFTAEFIFANDPNTTLIKLRQLGEALAQDIASRCGVVFDERTTQADLLFKLDREMQLDSRIRQLFHTFRFAPLRQDVDIDALGQMDRMCPVYL